MEKMEYETPELELGTVLKNNENVKIVGAISGG